jgi:hypothetical protein
MCSIAGSRKKQEVKRDNKEQKFIDLVKELGADYYENDKAVWVMPKKYGDYRMAFALRRKDNKMVTGYVYEDCLNFYEKSDHRLWPEEIIWVSETAGEVAKELKKRRVKTK